MAKRIFVLALMCCLGSTLSACSGGGGLGSILGGGCTPKSFSMNFPSDAGYSASGSIASSSGCLNTATVSTYTSLFPILGSAYTPTGTAPLVYVYFGFTFSATEYTTGTPSLNVTLPAGTATANRQFYVAYNYGTGGAFTWTPVAGPVTASGTSLSFGTGNGNTTFQGNQEGELAVYSVTGP